MKKITLLAIVALSLMVSASGQELSAREKAEAIAKNDFSKSKHERKEKNGVVKEKKKVIESTPFITTDLSFYQGNYVYQDLDYKMELQKTADDKWIANLHIANKPIALKNVTITDALFQAIKQNPDGTEEKWVGVFINKNDNGHSEFGLGIKLSDPVQVNEGLKATKIFLRKVSP